MLDSYQRNINYMRISITDRCNLRCSYCMPNGVDQLPMRAILTYEEIVLIAEEAAKLGISRLKITGGEPLVRLGACDLIKRLKLIQGIEQVTLTTNGMLLTRFIDELKSAGLDGVNISLDTLNADRFQAITGTDGLRDVLAGVDASLEAGIPTKINTVLQQGVNADEWYDIAQLARDRELDVRFIEMMPIGFGADCTGVSNETILRMLAEKEPQTAVDSKIHGNGPASYVKIPGFQGSIGFIGAIHGKFCDSCNRIRLTSTGKLKPCLCYGDTLDLMPVLRPDQVGSEGETLQKLKGMLEQAILKKPQQHHFEKQTLVTEDHRMIEIGG